MSNIFILITIFQIQNLNVEIIQREKILILAQLIRRLAIISEKKLLILAGL